MPLLKTFKLLVLSNLILGMLFLGPLSAVAQPTVVLLTSLDFEIAPHKTFHGLGVSNRAHQMVHQFSQVFKAKGYRVAVIHQADTSLLFKALHHPDVEAVFWLSHGSFISAEDDEKDFSLFISNKIVDSNGFDLSPTFGGVQANVKFLAIVSCNSQGIMAPIYTPVFLQNRPWFKTLLFNGKIEAKEGLTQAINMGLQHLLATQSTPTSQITEPVEANEESVEIKITRLFKPLPPSSLHTNKVIYPALRVEFRGQVVAVFDPENSQEAKEQVQRITLKIPRQNRNVARLKIKITMGDYALESGAERFEIGELKLEENLKTGKWHIFSDSEGVPLGEQYRLFLFSNE